MTDPRPPVSIIVPVLNEVRVLPALLRALAGRTDRFEIIVADGGSDDHGPDVVAGFPAVTLVTARRGRGPQMNAGAAVASGEVLLFLHADTRLPADAVTQITGALDSGHRWGRFDVRLDGPAPLLRVIETAMNLRSRLTGIATGDQAIFVERKLFRDCGGYAELPLMEDIELCRRLRRHNRPACLRARVTSSARHWQQHGILRTVLRMWILRLAWWLGASPASLARRYPTPR